MFMTNAIILCSGGLDSVTLAYYVKKHEAPEKMILLFFDYGQRSLKEELFCVKKVAKVLHAEVKVIDLPWLAKISTALLNSNKKAPEVSLKDLENVEKEREVGKLWWVPCRNALFVVAGLAHAESLFLKEKKKYHVYLGIRSEGQVSYKDSSPAFLDAVNHLARECTQHGDYKILAPLMQYDKDEIVSLAQQLHVPMEFTVSCYVAKGIKKVPVQCGVCPNCRQRQAAFYWANVKDPTLYVKK